MATKEFVKEEGIAIRKEISDLRKEIAEFKADIIKWLFIFWIGQLGAMLTIVWLFVKK